MNLQKFFNTLIVTVLFCVTFATTTAHAEDAAVLVIGNEVSLQHAPQDMFTARAALQNAGFTVTTLLAVPVTELPQQIITLVGLADPAGPRPIIVVAQTAQAKIIADQLARYDAQRYQNELAPRVYVVETQQRITKAEVDAVVQAYGQQITP